MVVVVNAYQIPQLQVTRCASSFAGNAFHSTSISEETKCMVVDQLKVRLVELGSSVGLSNCETHGVREALTKWSCGHFDARCVLSFWVPGGNAIDLLQANRESELPIGERWERVIRTLNCFKSSSVTL